MLTKWTPSKYLNIYIGQIVLLAMLHTILEVLSNSNEIIGSY